MKFHLYLTESEEKDLEMIKDFRKNTTQYFNEMGGVRLWRATKRIPNGLTHYKSRKDRKPKDTPQEVHEYFDKEFKKKYGWKVRSEGVFTASDPNLAETFQPAGGDTNIFYAANGYKYVYSTEIRDLLTELDELDILTFSGFGTWTPGENFKNKENLKKLTKYIIGTYTDKNLAKASWKGVEVVLNCPKGYYQVDGDFFKKYYDDIYEGIV